MNTLDALYSRQVPARGAVGADDATKSNGHGARTGRGQDGFAAALNGQAKGAKDGGKNARMPDEDDFATLGIDTTELKAADLESEPDAAYALLVSLFDEIRATVAKPEAETEAEPAEPVIDDTAANVDPLLAALDGEAAVAVAVVPTVAATAVAAGLADEQPALATEDTADAPVVTTKTAIRSAAVEPGLSGRIAAAETPAAGTAPQAVQADPAADAKPRAVTANAQAEIAAAKPDAPAGAAASADAKAEAPARQSTPSRTVDTLADAVRTATQSSPGGDAGAGAGGGEGRRNSDGAGSWAARAGATSAKVENVRTVESRSHAAPSLSGNAEAVIRTLTQAGDTLDLKGALANLSGPQSAQPAIGANADLHLNRPQTLHTLKIQLNPLELGQVTAVMRLTGEELSVELRVETPEAYRQLSSDSESIVRSLRAQGYGVDQVTVMQAGSDRSSSGGQGGQQQSFSSGQQFQSGSGQGSDGAGGSGEGRRGEGSRNANQQGDKAHDTAAPLHGGTGSSDGVYL